MNHRRRHLVLGSLGGILASWGLGFSAKAQSSESVKPSIEENSLLNKALQSEHQAIWAYTVVLGKLGNTHFGKTILAVAMVNLKDHQKHRDELIKLMAWHEHQLGFLLFTLGKLDQARISVM